MHEANPAQRLFGAKLAGEIGHFVGLGGGFGEDDEFVDISVAQEALEKALAGHAAAVDALVRRAVAVRSIEKRRVALGHFRVIHSQGVGPDRHSHRAIRRSRSDHSSVQAGRLALRTRSRRATSWVGLKRAAISSVRPGRITS